MRHFNEVYRHHPQFSAVAPVVQETVDLLAAQGAEIWGVMPVKDNDLDRWNFTGFIVLNKNADGILGADYFNLHGFGTRSALVTTVTPTTKEN